MVVKNLDHFEDNVYKCYIVFFGHKRDFLKQFDVLVVITVGCDDVCFLVLNEARHYKAKMQSF